MSDELGNILREALARRLGEGPALSVGHAPGLGGYIVTLSKSATVPYEKLTAENLEDEDFLDTILKDLYGIPEEE